MTERNYEQGYLREVNNIMRNIYRPKHDHDFLTEHWLFVYVVAFMYMFIPVYCCLQCVGHGWHGHTGVGNVVWHHFHVL